MSPEDRVRLLHMIEAADEAMLATDRKALFAAIRCIEIIGEAAARVSATNRNSAPDVPRNAIVGMRNRLVHAYFDVDADLVWKTTSVELPALKARLQTLV